eukprot:GFUD01111410.1.p1 GENE.GFUD01111410.1~~GFUD01111410.1.p1  ORF type:complete len:154 (+),score=49.66 GFUD01111410.1:220-681(+)
MGNYVGRTMEDNLKKNQEFMLEMNRITMERQIQMQDQMRERMVAMQIAKAREMFLWLGSFYVFAGGAMVAGFARTKKPAAIAPLLPLTFLVGYQADLAYGSKLNRIKAESENILQYERDLIEIPSGLPTLSSIDAGRIRAQEEKKYHATSPRN